MTKATRDPAFLAYLAERPACAPEHEDDLQLAWACARGDAEALRALEREHFARVDLLPPRHRQDAGEVVQQLRQRLLLADGDGKMRITEYTGRGPLRAWLRVAAVRLALNLQRARKRERPLDEDGELAQRAMGDVEVDDLKRRYGAAFKEACGVALASLEVRQRNLLRQHYLDGLTMEVIAPLYRVHRITIVRWMEKARAELARATRRELSARLRVERTELESILRLIESQLDVSMRAFFGEVEEAPTSPGGRQMKDSAV
jgi:RNA polymerase sigma-70 factor, ECF subfamily